MLIRSNIPNFLKQGATKEEMLNKPLIEKEKEIGTIIEIIGDETSDTLEVIVKLLNIDHTFFKR